MLDVRSRKTANTHSSEKKSIFRAILIGMRAQKTSVQRMNLMAHLNLLISPACFSCILVGNRLVQNWVHRRCGDNSQDPYQTASSTRDQTHGTLLAERDLEVDTVDKKRRSLSVSLSPSTPEETEGDKLLSLDV